MRQYCHFIIPSLIIAMLCTTTTQATNSISFELAEATIGSVHHAIEQHQLTCTQLVKDYLTRIETYDLSLNRGAPINAFVSLNPNIMTQAKTLDS